MLPKRIRMQAFASYAESAEIDFEKLDSLFLIHGETGAGKTAVLDAMMYALYGRSSGNERSSFRCALPQAAETPTEVEFEFRSGGELYRFTRSIFITPRSKELKAKQDCFIYDEKEQCFRALLENPTQTKVEREAERITGLTADQFRQVVILPQGQFERLLTSDSDDKEKTLSTLFAAEKYTAISAKLSEKADAFRKKVAEESMELNAMLAAEKAESIEQLREKAEIAEKEKSELEPAAEQARKALAEIRERLGAAEVLAEKFSARDNSAKRLAELDADSGRIGALREALAKNTEAGKLRPSYSEKLNAAEAVKQRSNRLAVAVSAAEAAEKDYAQAVEKGRQIAEKETEYKSDLQEKAVLGKLAEVYEKISAAEQKRKKIDAERCAAEKNCGLLDISVKKADEGIAALEKERSEIHSVYTNALPALAARKAALENGAEAERNLLNYVAGYNEIQKKIGKLKSETAVLAEKKTAAEQKYDRLYEQFILHTAAELSSSLKEGMPCPVCGSREHPHPAEKSADAVTSEMVRAARTAFETAAAAVADKEAETARQEARIPVAEEHIGRMKKIIEECGYSAEELRDVRARTEIAEKKNALLPQIEEKLKGLQAQLGDLKSKRDAENQRVIELKNGFATADAEAAVLRGQLDKRYPDERSYKAGVIRLAEKISAYEQARSGFEEKMRAAEKRKIETAAAVEQAREELAAAQKSSDAAEKAFVQQLSSAGFATEEMFTRALLSEKTAAEYAAETERYALERHSAKERLEQLSAELEGKEKPELEALRSSAAESENRLSELSARGAVAAENAARLKKVIEKYTVKFADGEKRREQCDKLTAFAKFMHGGKGISFTRYMLGIMLGLVVDEANRILSDIHGGRFRLCIKKELSASSKQGLDLEVENITAGAAMKYGVKDLSGGEKFLISLALSLGLSSVARSRSGGIEIEAMFIDEGFGSLDPDSLREAISILCGLTSRRNTIGIISHVEELKSVIPCGVNVVKDKTGCSKILSTV